MTDTEAFQISPEGAEIYEAQFVPGIFAEWAPLLVDSASVRAGQAVLDVACGTGIVARRAADRLGADGAVIGIDLNAAMLAVARRVRPDLNWQQGDVADLPFPDRTFDTVLCQMALMFFPDRAAALTEMARVTTAGGTVAVVVPAAINDQPAYGPLVDVVAREAGQEAALMLDTYWSCGDLTELRALFASAGLEVTATRTHTGTATFSSADALVATEVEGSPLIERISDDVYDRIKVGARAALAPFLTAEGTLEAPLRGHIVVASKP